MSEWMDYGFSLTALMRSQEKQEVIIPSGHWVQEMITCCDNDMTWRNEQTTDDSNNNSTKKNLFE